MRIIIVDSDTNFANSIVQRCKKANVFCQVIPSPAAALGEMKKNPDAIDIVLVSKELVGAQDGLSVVQAMRKEAKTADIPYIIMSSVWGKPEFAKHQKSEFGANAYFSKKSAVAELEATIEAVTGFKFSEGGTNATKMTQTGSGALALNVQLQAASDVVNISEDVPSDISISTPIVLFPDEGAPQAPVSAISPPRVETPASTPSASAPGPASTPAPENTGRLDIEINVGGIEASSANIEATSVVASAPPAPNNGGGIDINLDGTGLQIQKSTLIEAPAASTVPVEASSVSALLLDVGDLMPPTESEAASLGTATPVAGTMVDAAGIPPTEAGPQSLTEEEAAKDLPYLFAGPAAELAGGHGGHTTVTKINFSQSTPPPRPQNEMAGGSGASDDVETLKKYLTMREQDVSVLTAQLTYAKEELEKSESVIKRLSLENEDLFHQINDLQKKNEELDSELSHASKNREGELEQLRFEVKSKIDRIRFLDDRLSDSAQQYEKLKERVRVDIRKIRVREKELESKLEIARKDAETLIAARENKILELKRKIDLLEFNYDMLQDKTELEKNNVTKANEKIERVLKVIKLAMGVIEGEQNSQEQDLKGAEGGGSGAKVA